MMQSNQRLGMWYSTAQRLAKDVIELAHLSGMPDTYWLTDQRIARACKVLKITPQQARDEIPH